MRGFDLFYALVDALPAEAHEAARRAYDAVPETDDGIAWLRACMAARKAAYTQAIGART